MEIFWFEYGGNKIGRLNLDIIYINQQKMKVNHQNDSDCSDPEALEAAKSGNFYKWKPVGKYRDEFSPHQAIVFNTDNEYTYVLGSNGNKQSCLMWNGKAVKVLSQMPSEKTFFANVYFDNIIYTFGGYDAYDKVQLRSCEYYNIKKDQWHNSEQIAPMGKVEFELHNDRS